MQRVVGPTGGDQRGGGGKVRKPPSRKPPATPYARPPDAEHLRRRWLSKLVDPACRLISGGATRILPSFFTKSELTSASDAEVEGFQQSEEQNHGDNDHGCIPDPNIPNLTGEAGPSGVTDKLNCGSNFSVPKIDEKVRQYGNNDLSEIKRLVQKATFSRDQANHLMEILRSRTMELSNFDQGRESKSLITGENKSGFARRHDFLRISDELKQENSNGRTREPSTPFLQSHIHDEIGASPVDIARAYMFSQEAGVKETFSKSENTTFGDGASVKPKFPSPTQTTCWPGAVVKDAYLTPQNQRGRYGFQNFPRTPYSRTILSRSKAKLNQNSGDDHVSTTSYQQSLTPRYGQIRSGNKGLDGEYGSVRPIRRIRHNSTLQSSWRGSPFVHSSVNGPSQMENSRHLEDLDQVATKNIESGEVSCGTKILSSDSKPGVSEVRIPPVHSHTILMARKILEHIDRNPPTPKEKSAELKMAIKWKQPDLAGGNTNVLSNEKNRLLQFRDPDPQKSSDRVDGEKNYLLNHEGQGTHKANVAPDKSKASNGISKGFLFSNFNIQSTVPVVDDDDARKSKGIPSAHDVPFNFKFTPQDLSMPVPEANCSVDVQMKQSNFSVGKPGLSSISISKPESKWAFTSDSGSGFTFPVSASSSVLSEPPTPSIMPTSLAGPLNESKEEPTIPQYSFGLTSSSAALVFSFPSTSTAASHDVHAIKFNFGSDQNSRLSFSSFDNNAVCY